MIGFFKRLFSGGGDNSLRVEAYWCSNNIKLQSKIKTPTGSKVTQITVCVDVDYRLDGPSIEVLRVRLSRGGGHIIGSRQPINVAASRTGEAWYAHSLCTESYLRQAVLDELQMEGSSLRRIMLGKWRQQFGPEDPAPLVEALNKGATSEEIFRLLQGRRGTTITFTYVKANGSISTRKVVIKGISGNCLRAVEQEGQESKSFRLDRIRDVRLA
jgi:hypothetical protein